MSRQKHVLSFGGGVNSTALMLLLVEQRRPLDEVVFSDTGGEVPETYEYLRTVSSYLEEHDIPLGRVISEGGFLYDRCVRRRVVPSQIWRWCTRDFKILPIYAHYRSLGVHVNQYLGISYEERDRKRESGVPYVTNKYPLISKRINRDRCIDMIIGAGLRIPVRSGCFFCPFNSISRWAEIYRNHRNLYSKAMTLEENSKHFPKQRLMRTSLRTLKEKLEDHEPLPQVHVRRPCGSECLI
jgi:3'-phosphoadenosine 5'-phosphosulfate sulfotransferase (PAPS reductase)/FAD synthetase